ncbi:hypothetical protein GOBAR_DD05204 [Gossypium barbadense]|nr:hypothetical protein GOBAR_DD05204 [Gossypium barbadense]
MRVLGEFPDLNILEPKGGVVNAVNNNQMQNGGSNEASRRAGGLSGNLHEPDLEMHGNTPLPQEEIQPGSVGDSACEANPTSATNVVTKAESHLAQQPIAKLSKDAESTKEDLPHAASPKMGYFSRTTSAHEQCRVCQQEKEEGLIDLGCQCKGGLAKAHQSCIVTWFHTKGSNKCEICQVVAVNVTAPQPERSVGILCLSERRNYWVWRINPRLVALNRERGCFSPLWLALSILIGGLLLDMLISLTLGVSALPVNLLFCFTMLQLKEIWYSCYRCHRTRNRPSTCSGILPRVEYQESVAKGRNKCNNWVPYHSVVYYSGRATQCLLLLKFAHHDTV